MVQDLTAQDLGLGNDEEPLDVLDLPQLYTKPAATTLLATLADLRSQPSSWGSTPRSGSRSISGASTPHKRRKIKKEGVPAYLTKIISSALQWIDDDDEKEQIWENAAQELSARSGRTAQGDLTRTFSIPLTECAQESDDEVELLLHEPALTADNLGLKTWASSFMLAKRLCLLKDDLSPTTVLELGAGTGLVGMAAACVFSTHVVMTDLPEIVPNLERNTLSNASIIRSCGGEATAAVLDWTRPDLLDGSQRQPESFSLILAADVIYSEEHPRMLATTIQYHLSRSHEARVVVESPLRRGYTKEIDMLRDELPTIGLIVASEGEEIGYDDWSIDDGGPAEVRCWWSVWKWK